MADTPSRRLGKWIQYPPHTGVVEVSVADQPEWLATFPDQGRIARRVSPSFFEAQPVPDNQDWRLAVYPAAGRLALRRTQWPSFSEPFTVPDSAAQLVIPPTYPDRVLRRRLLPSQQQASVLGLDVPAAAPSTAMRYSLRYRFGYVTGES